MSEASFTSRPRQLALPFVHAPEFTSADVLEGASNEQARAWLARTGAWPNARLALYGAAGTGKSHLLHVWAKGAGAAVLYGPMLREWGLALGPVAIDDADAAVDEAVLLHLLNQAAAAGQPVLLAGREPPARWSVRLADLTSRLRATVAAELGAPCDELLRALLARLLSDRQVTVAAPLQDWLRARLPRTAGAMREAAARLDRAALASGGRVTRLLAAQVVADMTEQESEIDDSFSKKAAGPSPFAPAFL